jgi:hypothetical protein
LTPLSWICDIIIRHTQRALNAGSAGNEFRLFVHDPARANRQIDKDETGKSRNGSIPQSGPAFTLGSSGRQPAAREVAKWASWSSKGRW